MNVVQRGIPPGSALVRGESRFYYRDAFEARLSRTELSITEIYLAIFTHHPWWAKLALVARAKVVSVFGLKGTALADLNDVEIKKAYAVGEKIAGRFTLFWQDENEIIAGRNDKHLDFRVSVLRMTECGVNKVVLSTVVNPHNFFGKAYLFLILPFHKLGVRAILSNSVNANWV